MLDADGTGIHSHKIGSRTHNDASLRQQIDLKTLLASPDKDWTEMTKITLAVILAYSLFYLYGGSWVSERWSQTNILFFGGEDGFPLRPFLSSDPEKLGGPLYNVDGQHKYPEFLELGVILLEIHLGKKLGSYLGRKTDISDYDELWLEASKVFKERKLYLISTAYRDAIDKCLKPDFSISGTCDDQMLRDSLFKHIVEPLEIELEKVFSEFISLERLDEDAEQINLLESKVNSMSTFPPVAKVADSSPPSERSHLNTSPLDFQPALPLSQGVITNTEARVHRPNSSQVSLFADENESQPGEAFQER